ncbi:autotransporter assembly complex protein TamA [Azonexus sp.]|uniref:autotransporter assembly complex protein TamA n=1 Tax=Azonexus sp. TaxID=1872668 RepID=UPI0039E276E0
MRWWALGLCCSLGVAQAEVRLEAPEELALRLRPYLSVENGARRLRQLSADLLATEGYFSPQITLDEAEEGVHLRIDPGPRTRVQRLDIVINGPLSLERRAALLAQWGLPVGQAFRQEDWNQAKTQLLDALLAEDHAGARLLDSLADIDPQQQRAALSLDVDAGPRYVYGDLQIEGLQRFRPALIARYKPGLRPGQPYRAEDVRALVQALQASPYFSRVQAELDLEQAQTLSADESTAHTRQAPLRLRVQEQPIHRARFGLGASSNTGARVEAAYGNIDFLRRAWQLETGLRLEEKRQTFFSDVFLPPTTDGVRYGGGFVAEQSDIEQLRLQRQALGWQRSEQRGRLEERWSVQWQHEKRQPGGQGWTTSRALAPSVSWTWRELDQLIEPRRGVVLQVSLGGGSKVFFSDQNFLRLYGRGQFYVPLGARDSLSLRLELGRTFADARQHVPQDYLFRTGGTGSVRGYPYQSLGIKEGNAVVGGRYLATASLEYTHWLNARWGVAAFVDAGDAVDALQDARLAVGYGLGARWRSPAGPLGVDLAYGARDEALQLHFSLLIPF